MSEYATLTTPPPDPSIGPSLLARLASLRRRKRIINSAINKLIAQARLLSRDRCDCLHCGFTWTPYNPYLPPHKCARCGSTGWNHPPGPGDHKPSDPPCPSWRTRKGARRRPKLRIMSGEPQRRRTPAEMEAAKKTAISDAINKVTMEHIIPHMDVIADYVFGRPVPPRIAAILPPPPAIAPTQSLSERFAQLRAEQGEPQPEQVSSHAAPPEVNDEPLDSDNNGISTSDTLAPLPDPPASPVDDQEGREEMARVEVLIVPEVPQSEPEYRDNALTERELEELRAAEEDVAWPTTQPED